MHDGHTTPLVFSLTLRNNFTIAHSILVKIYDSYEKAFIMAPCLSVLGALFMGLMKTKTTDGVDGKDIA